MNNSLSDDLEEQLFKSQESDRLISYDKKNPLSLHASAPVTPTYDPPEGGVPEGAVALALSTTLKAPSLASPLPSWLEGLILLFSGVSSLWYWNTILNLSEILNPRYFSDYESSISNMMTFVFELSAVLSFLICFKIDPTTEGMQCWIVVSKILISVITPFILLITNSFTRLIIWLVMTVLFGAWVGVQQLSHFALAANLPSGVKTVLISSGQGISGILSYALFWAVIKGGGVGPFPAICLQMGILVIITILGPGGMWWIRRRREVSDHLNEQKKVVEEMIREKGSPGILKLLKKGWFPLLNVSITFVFSYIVFPNVGPFKWPTSYSNQIDQVMGCSQLGQVLGRSAPLLPSLIFSIKKTFVLNCLRIVFPILFVLAAVKTQTHAFSTYWFQCIMLFTISLTEGWLASLGLLHSALAGDNILEKAELSKYSSGVLSVAITLGLGLTFPLRAIFGI